MDEASNSGDVAEDKSKPVFEKAPTGLWSNIYLSIYAAIFCSIYACFSALTFTADLMVHFRLQMAAVLFLMVFILARSYKYKPSPKLLAATAFCLILNMVCIGMTTLSFDGAGPLPQGAVEKADKAGPGLSLLQANLNTANRENERFCSFVLIKKPDVVCIQEYGRTWVTGLVPLYKEYPYRILRPRDDNFGIGIFSRYPIENAVVVPFGSAAVPTACCDVLKNGKRWTVLSTHPVPPVSSDYYGMRNEHYKEMAKYLNASKAENLVVAGDFNCTPWSAHFMNFLSASGLSDTRRGFGLGESWPVNCPILRIPIDHVLTSKNIRTRVRVVEAPLGSDHLPVYVELTAGGFTKRD